MNSIHGQIGGSNLRDKIKSTEAYQNLSKIQQKMFLSGNNIRNIQHAINVIGNIGFEEWYRISDYSFNSIEIIKELTKN